MPHVLLMLFLLGAFVVLRAAALGRRRTITPRAAPEVRPDFRIPAPAEPAPIEDAPWEPEPVAPALVATATPADRPAYLLTGRPAGAAPDRMAAAMAMMAGPGICTPPDG